MISKNFGYIFPVVLMLVIFMLYPVMSLFYYGLEPETGKNAAIFTLDNYSKLLSSKFYLTTIANSVLLCLPTSIVAIFASLAAAWHMAGHRKGATLLRVTFTFSYAFGGIIYGIIFIFLLGNVGIVSLIEGMITHTSLSAGFAYTPFGLAVAYLLFQIPRSALFLASALEKMDRDLIPGARTLGASRLQILTLVVLPLFKKQIVSTIILIFSMSMSSYGVALLIAHNYPIFPLEIYKIFNGNADLHIASAMGIILFAAVSVINTAILCLGRSSSESRN